MSTPSSSGDVTRAFVAGATGFAGRHVVAALVARGIKTIAHVRPDAPRRARWAAHFEALGAEVNTCAWDLAAMSQALEGHRPTHVFALLGTTRKRARRDGAASSYAAVDVGLTTLLLHAAQTLQQQPVFVYLSSAGAGQLPGAYLAARHTVERRLVASKLPYLIARPGLFTGARDEARPAEAILARLMPPFAALLRRFGAPGCAAQCTPMTGAQLGEALVICALHSLGHDVICEAADLQQSLL